MARSPDRRRDRHRRRRPPRPVSDRRRAEDRRAFGILALATLAIVAVGALIWASRTPALDETTGCGLGALVPPAHTVVLVDQTDPLTARQIDYAKVLILTEYQQLKPGAKLTVRSISTDPDSRVREFARCRVRRGEEVSGVTNNPDMIEADFRRIVGDSLNNYLDDLATAPTAAASPILETIDSVVDGPDFGGNVPERRLIVISDMAQHSNLATQYGDPPPPPVLPAERRDLLQRDLDGVEVLIHYVRRPQLTRLQTSQHRRFWTDWFESQGADVSLGWGLQLGQPEPAEPA